MRIVLLDKGNKDYLIGRTTEEPIRLKFDANGDLLFRTAVGGYIPAGSYAEFQKINGDATSRAGKYLLEANLDLMNVAWTPVGNNSNRFTGVFDGDHKTISRLSMNSASMDYAGLFGAIGVGGSVQNFNLIDVNITGRNYIGSTVGHSEGTITSIKSNGKISGTDYTGGIAGYLTNGSNVETCENNAAINGRDRVGGIAGYVFTADNDSEKGNIINACKNAGTVTGTGTMTGGIAGQIRNNNTVRNCYSTGNINGVNNVGGVAGNVYYTGSVVEYCYASGTVSGTTGIGGVAGLVNAGGNVRNCVALNPTVQASTSNIGRVAYMVGGNLIYNLAWDGISNGSGISFTGGTMVAHNRMDGKSITSGQARMRTTYVDYVDSDLPDPLGWDFINTWKINEGNGYPTLQWE
jgi:hypothetical protein